MADRIEQEFYRSSWQRVLPIGPDGIQPYVRPDHRPARIAGRRRVAAMLRALAQGLSDITEGLGAFGSFGRWGATGSDSRAMPAGTTRRPLSARPSRAAPRTAAGSMPRRLRKAA